MRTYTVFWNYVANSGTRIIKANTEEHAMRQVINGYSEDFAKQATLCAVDGIHVFRKASGMAEVEVLGTRGCRAILNAGLTAIVDQDAVTDEDPTVWVTIDGARTRIETSSVSEYLPADGVACNAGGGVG